MMGPIRFVSLAISMVFFVRDARAQEPELGPSADFINKTWVPQFAEQSKRIDQISFELAEMKGLKTAPKEELLERTEKLELVARSLAGLTRDFSTDSARHGFLIELDAVEQSQFKMETCLEQLVLAGGIPITELLNRSEGPLGATRQAYGLFRSQLVDAAVAESVDLWLETEGVGAILTADSLDEAKKLAVAKAKEECVLALQEKVIGWRERTIHDLPSARQALKFQVRANLSRIIKKFAARFTGSSLVLMFIDKPILNWLEKDLWPKLRESLRPKGNIPERVAQSVATLEDSRNELNKLGGMEPDKQDLNQVKRAIDRANGRLAATYYLKRDIVRENDSKSGNQLSDAIRNLERTITLTKARFLVDNLQRLKAVEEAQTYFDYAAQEIRIFHKLMEERGSTYFVSHSNLPSDQRVNNEESFPSRTARVAMTVELFQSPENSESLELVMTDFVVLAEYQGQSTCAYFNATSDGAHAWIGDAPIHGLDSGVHPIAISILTEDQRTMEFIVPVEVSLPRSSDETLVEHRRQIKIWTETMKKIQSSGQPPTINEKTSVESTLVHEANALIDGTHTPAAEILNLLKGARTIHEKMGSRPNRMGGAARSLDGSQPKTVQENSDAKRELGFYSQVIRTCKQLGTTEALAFARELLPKCEEIARQNAEVTTDLGPVYRDMAALAVIAGGEIQPAAEYLGKQIDIDERLNRFPADVIERWRKDLPFVFVQTD